MIYEYHCTDPECGNVQDEECSVNSFKEYRPACNVCGKECEYHFAATAFHFVLKDGPSGSWPSKGDRIKRQRIKASVDAKRRQDKRYKNPSLVPNFKGKQTESWREAREEALKDRGLDSAATYDQKVSSEVKP